MKLVIVGGVAGGASAATRARRLSEEATIVIFERGPDVSFANCGLPYYIGGEITQRDKLLVVTPERFRDRYRLDVRTRSEVQAIDRPAKKVRVRDLATGRDYDESYDKLILAPGAAPIRPPLPGIDLPGIFTLRSLDDTDRIKAAVDRGARRAVVIGAGFIGLEVVENLVRRGIDTTLVELQDQVLPPVDKELTPPILDQMRRHGVRVVLGQSADGFEPDSDGLAVRLKSGERLPAHLVVLGVGVRPENSLAVAAGLDIGPRGGIRVNEHMQTSDPDIYAVGDAVEVRDFVTGEPTQVPLAGPANRQGRIAADHIFGRPSRYRGTQGTAIVRVFDVTVAMTGASEKTLRRLQRPFLKVYVHPSHHAGYYPGAQPMTLKLLFQPNTGKILGAQIVGGAGVDKRIDILAVAIQAGMTVFDLEEMELAYAPQFGSAKDPINMVGFVAAGLLRGDHPQVTADQLLDSTDSAGSSFLLDVRTPQEFQAGHIPQAVNIPLDQLRSRLGELPSDRPLTVYCQAGLRGYLATRLLRQKGFDAANISGGYTSYRLFDAARAPHATPVGKPSSV
ncbi:MAG: FAD-dependent oxidoreductase [Gemmataceae bacterium]|nr:FAD-dependent oxidoreductase [Gemmataceae bacterium]MDW8264305.1 FAD-dependent oxidoreductase [Gemmataceae bacterium]